MSQYRFSPAERFGVWEAHDGMCFWCGMPLEYRHTTIDHVLPECLESTPKKLSAILESFALSPDFKINDFLNWVPAHQACNSKKNSTVFSPSPVMVASLEYISRRASIARSVSEKVAEDRKKGRILALLEDAATEGLVTEDEIICLFKGNRTAAQADAPLVTKDETLSFEELRVQPVKRPIALRISSNWTVVEQENGIVYVTKGNVFGYTTSATNPDSSFICPFCSSAGPWNGVFCLSCHRMSDPAD